MEVLEFVFKNFWHWLGSFLLLGVIFGGISGLVRGCVVRIKNKD